MIWGKADSVYMTSQLINFEEIEFDLSKVNIVYLNFWQTFYAKYPYVRCMVSNVFCFFNYPKLSFCCEWAITRSCSHSLLNTWFTLHSSTCYWYHTNWDDNNASITGSFVGSAAVPTLFQILRAAQLFFAKFQKKCVEYLLIYSIICPSIKKITGDIQTQLTKY